MAPSVEREHDSFFQCHFKNHLLFTGPQSVDYLL